MHKEPASQTPKPDPLLGHEIAGRYRVLRRIAKGGMGWVYEAEQLPLGRRVAVKILREPPNSRDSTAFQQRFFLEASTLARLNHPHTVTLHDYGQTQDGLFYLVMEFVRGRTLSRLLQAEGPLPAERTLPLMLQVARALQHAHKHGVVHRDLKPGNLLIQRDEDQDQVKVVDFGLVKLTEGDQDITVTGMILGSPHCMAPEQVHGADIDERADIYALGVLLYRCLTGAYPFHGQTSTATMLAHIQQPVPSIAERFPDVALPEGMDAVVQRCLAKDPEDRYPDMRAVIRALAACADVASEEHSGMSTMVEVPAPSRAPLYAAIGAAVLLVCVGLAWMVVGDEPREPAVQQAEPLGPAAKVTVALRSDPPGAVVRTEGRTLGQTPLDVQLSSRGEPDLRSFEFSLSGHISSSLEHDLAGPEQQLLATLEPLGDPQALAIPPSPELDLPTEPPRAQPRARPRPARDAAQPPEASAEEPTPAEASTTETEPAEGSAPAGYKANPFD